MRRAKLPAGEFTATIESLTLEGRGVTHLDGKATFIDRALPGETVRFVYTARKKQFDEGDTVAIEQPSPNRVVPGCPHFEQCGACTMQHLAAEQQILFKQQSLLDQLERIGKVRPETVLPPLTDAVWGYRRRARLGVRFVEKKQRLLIGFRERHSHFLADLSRCVVLDPRIGERLTELAEALNTLDIKRQIPQIEVSCSDDRVALVIRHLAPLEADDRARLRQIGQTFGYDLYLQSGGPATVTPLAPDEIAPLIDHHPAFDVSIGFAPLDFTQVHAGINRKMVAQAIELLGVTAKDRVLDLFAGLGNFTLPLARRAAKVTAVELESAMVARAAAAAEANGLSNTAHVVGDLFTPDAGQSWLNQPYDLVLLDPPRAGAEAMIPHLARLKPRRIVYVSCHPGTLARDAQALVHEHGYRLTAAGVMNMFPHTAHIESMAVFEPAA
ncbi:23S rRNA (uracil(1939)-C(5))-methyltransferase RlmD [Halothiobacillus sp. DCM-1]|uniref:23S rRNA (uracil(1939)-C(5))-methyltransferase RlmD n=1 Tax=Halothiobacillus sp. DCM-1 TaxID=3112558 RepID=UPI00325413CE